LNGAKGKGTEREEFRAVEIFPLEKPLVIQFLTETSIHPKKNSSCFEGDEKPTYTGAKAMKCRRPQYSLWAFGTKIQCHTVH